MKKILLIRFSSIGDIVLISPVVRALKKQLNCELHILTKKQYATISENNPNVDMVHLFDNNTKEVIADLKKEKFDFVVDLQKNLRSHKILKALKTPFASFPKLNIEKWLLVNFKINQLPNKHIVDRYFEAVSTLAVKNDGKGLEYYYPEEEKIDSLSISKSFKNGFAAWVIGGQHFTKIMPAEKVASIISKMDIPVVLLGGKDDKARGDEILRLTKSKSVFNSCGRFSLNGSASLVEQSRLVLTNDTGLMHIAAAFKKPIISLWGNTIPEFGMYPYIPGEENKFIVSEVKNLKCRPCSKLGYKKCPKKHFECMLQQDEVFIIEKVVEFTNINSK